MLNRFLYRSYSAFFRSSLWRSRHISPSGYFMLIVFGITVFAGMNVYRTSLYQAAVLAGCFLLFSFLSGLKRFQAEFEITRHLPSQVVAQDSFEYEIEIVNQSDRVQKGLVLYEEVHDPRPDADTLFNTREPGEHLRNLWDRKVLYYRWNWLVRKNKNLEADPVMLPDLFPDKPVRVKITATTSARGYVRFKGITIARPDIFGFFHRTVFKLLASRLLVLPQARAVDLPFTSASRHYHPGGIQLALSIGNSDEFVSLRQYRPGDPLRHIHWKSFAKTQELVIREFEDEFFARQALILDTAVPHDRSEHFEAAVQAAAWLIPHLKTRDGVVDLLVTGDPVYAFSAGRGLGRMEQMMEIIACVKQNPEKAQGNMLAAVEKRLPTFSGVICILSCWNPDHKKLYELLKASKIAFHMMLMAHEHDTVRDLVKKDVPDPACIQLIDPLPLTGDDF